MKISRNLLTIKANLWNSLFLLLCFFSLGWSIYFSETVGEVQIVLKKTIVILVMCYNIRSQKDIQRILKIFLLAFTVMMIKLSINMAFVSQVKSSFWDDVCGIHFNTVAQILSLGIIISYYLFRTCSNKRNRVLYVLFIAFAYYYVFLTGSRKGLLIPIVAFIIYRIIYSGTDAKKVLRSASVIILIIVVGVFVLSRNSYMAERLNVIVDLFLEGEATDGSSALRVYFIQLASQMFRKNPMIGCGANTFGMELYNATGMYRYSHNNYMEILSGLGIIGLITYYWFYAYIIIKSYQSRKENELFVMICSIVITLAIFEYGIVTYNIYIYPIMLSVFSMALERRVMGNSKVAQEDY